MRRLFSVQLVPLKQDGFSLTELLVALVVAGVFVIGVAGGYVVQKGTYEAEASVRDMQMNGRIALDQVARVIRNAGLGCRDNFPPTGTDTIQGAFRTVSAIFTAQNRTTGPDAVTVVTGLSSRTRIQADSQTAVFPFQSVDGFDITTGRYVFVAPWDQNRFLTILSLSGQNVTVSAARPVKSGDKVFRVNAYTITLDQRTKSLLLDVDGDGTTVDGDGDQIPDLAIFDNRTDLAQEVLTEVAEGIEDLQFQYGWDADENGVIDPGEYVNDPTGNEQRIRAVRIFVLARSVLPDRNFIDPNPSYTIADRTIFLDTNDGNGIDSDFDRHYHRHLLVETVMVRNRNL